MKNRILIVRLSALGDTALTLPLFFALRERIPEAYVGWVVGESAAPLISGLSELNRVHVVKEDASGLLNWIRVSHEIRAERYTVSIDPQGLTRSALIPFAARIPMRIGFAPSKLEGRELAPLLTTRRVSPPKNIRHVAWRNLHLIQGLALKVPDMLSIQLPCPRATGKTITDWWRASKLGERALVFGPGAGWPTKTWSVTEMLQLVAEARRQGFTSVLLWGPQEEEMLLRWLRILGDLVICAPRTNIPEMLALLRSSAGYVGPDSAPLHLAWLLGKPTFSWFGASDPARTAPVGPTHRHIARGPHDWNRRKRAPTGLQTLKAAEVLPLFREWLLSAALNSNPAPNPLDLGSPEGDEGPRQ